MRHDMSLSLTCMAQLGYRAFLARRINPAGGNASRLGLPARVSSSAAIWMSKGTLQLTDGHCKSAIQKITSSCVISILKAVDQDLALHRSVSNRKQHSCHQGKHMARS